jgi:hypothetical protein
MPHQLPPPNTHTHLCLFCQQGDKKLALPCRIHLTGNPFVMLPPSHTHTHSVNSMEDCLSSCPVIRWSLNRESRAKMGWCRALEGGGEGVVI